MKSTDWIGFRQGSLTIVSFDGLDRFAKGKAARFTFRCDCGTEFSAQKSNVIGRGRVDCGHSAEPQTRTAPPGATKHPLHKVWWHMIDRCQNPRNKSFKDYGGRGVQACSRWAIGENGLTGFECFLADMGPHEPGMTIERVDRDGDYRPGNCMWLPKPDQSRNRRGVKLVRIGDRVKTIPGWCAETGVPYWTAIRRIARGWPPDRAVTKAARSAR